MKITPSDKMYEHLGTFSLLVLFVAVAYLLIAN
jgi:hypothetical protein